MRRSLLIACILLTAPFAFAQEKSDSKTIKEPQQKEVKTPQSTSGNLPKETKKLSVSKTIPAKKKKLTLEWVMGIAKGITEKAVNISYYDFEDNKDKELTVYIDADTEFLGATSAKAIRPGDDIEASYTYGEDGRPIAKVIIVSSSPFDEKTTKKEQ